MIAQETQTSRLRQFLVPSWLEVLVYTASAFILLLLMNASHLWQVFIDKATDSTDIVENSHSVFNFDSARVASFAGNITVLLFWLAVGSFVYVVIWLTQNSLSEVKHEVGSGQMITGDTVERNYMNSLIAHYIFFCALTVFTLISIYFTFIIILPIINAAFYGTAITISQLDPLNIISGLSAVMLVGVLLYILKLLIQIYVRFWRIYIRAQ